MNLLRKLLFPFAILYGFITSLRNYLYDKGVFRSYSFDVPVIAVGNLSVGGTGKTPQIEYLIRLLSPNYKIATLSRGYKRKSEGFVLADANANAETLGDEPFQYFSKFPNIKVAVDADRKNGIELLLKLTDAEIILLDDAYQHRKVKAGYYILLTSYGDLFADDFMLPTGNLRERPDGAHRADVIIVTKCPAGISESERNGIKGKLLDSFPSRKDRSVEVFFSTISYDDEVHNEGQTLPVSQIKSEPKLLLAGIAKPKPFFDYLQSDRDEILEFPDHHHFSESEISDIKKQAAEKIIVTTEKDFVRLKAKFLKNQLYYLPIKSQLIENQSAFDQLILNYVGSSTANR